MWILQSVTFSFLFFSVFFLNYLHAEQTVWHVDLEICVNVSTEIQFVKSDIRCSATEVKFSYQAWWPVSSSVQKAISVSIKRFCLSRPQKGYLGLPFPEKSGEKEHLWFTNSQAYVPQRFLIHEGYSTKWLNKKLFLNISIYWTVETQFSLPVKL